MPPQRSTPEPAFLSGSNTVSSKTGQEGAFPAQEGIPYISLTTAQQELFAPRVAWSGSDTTLNAQVITSALMASALDRVVRQNGVVFQIQIHFHTV